MNSDVFFNITITRPNVLLYKWAKQNRFVTFVYEIS